MNEVNSGIDEAHARHREGEATGSSLHPRVYMIVIGLAVWFVLAVWIFAGGGISDYLLFIVSGFICVCIALMLILASVTTVEKLPTGEPQESEPKRQSFSEWMRDSFDTWSGPLSGKQAMVQVLLPFAAASLGMTIFGVLLHFGAAGA
jgi:hypothetical protein